MYEAHFGLRGHPFGETLSLTSYVALPSRESVSRRVRYGLEHGQGPAIVFGPPGTGKTLLVRALARELDVPTAHLTFPAMPAAELLDFVAEELGAGSGGGGSVLGAVRRLRPWLSAAVVRGGRPLVVVDEAHLIDDPATFEALRLLLNFATAGPPDISLLLVGAPEMLLRIPTGLADRLTAKCLVGPLSESESSAYVLGRIAASGVEEPLFDSEALNALHRAADGLPRRLNRLADLALLIAYAQGLSRPDTHAVATAARELDFDGLAA